MIQTSWVGKKLGNRYMIEELLGEGGMSAVFRARDPNLRRDVAIKIIHPQLSHNPEFVSRFEEEAAAVAQLQHPNIIQVFDFNHDDDTYFMVLAFIQGETLYERLERLNESHQRMAVNDAVKYAINICDAMGYAHDHGMYHRDIKPANVMINQRDQAVLMDFGIAKIVGGKQHTAAGAVIGTALYMAPEQIRGVSPDHRLDIYSTGVVLFEMVSGRPPFDADSAMSLMMMHVNDPVPDLRELQPGLPDDLVAVIGKALAKNPDQRYQSATDMAKELKKVLARLDAALPETKLQADRLGTIKVARDDLKEVVEADSNKTISVESTGSKDPFRTMRVSSPDFEGETDALKTLHVSPKMAEEDPLKTFRVSSDAPLEDDEPMKTVMVSSQETATADAAFYKPANTASAVAQPRTKCKPRWWLIISIVAVILVLIIGGTAMMGVFNRDSIAKETTATNTAVAMAIRSPTPEPTLPPTATIHRPPTEMPAETSTPNEELVPTEEQPPFSPWGNPIASQPGEEFFYTEFDDQENWWGFTVPEENEDTLRVEANGYLEVEETKEDTTLYMFYDLDIENPDVYIESTVEKVSGPNSNRLGIVCRYTEAGYYMFTFSSNGFWFINLWTPQSDWIELASGPSKEINLTEASNEIAADCLGDSLIFFINGVDVASVTDNTLPGPGQVGLVVWGEYPGLFVSFDYFGAWVP